MKDKDKTKVILPIKGICDAIGDGISVQDTDFIVLYQNQAHKDLIGDHVGEYCYKAYQGKDNVCRGCPIAMAFKDGKIHKTERNATIDGVLMHAEVTASLLRGPSGEVIAGIETIRDITETKKEAENIFNIINDAITIHDMEFNIINSNNAAKDLLGINLKKILSQKCFKTYHGTDCPPEGCPSCSVLKTGKPASSEVFEPHLKKYIEIRAFPRFDIKGKLIGLLHIVRDISARKNMEIELQGAVSKLLVQTEELQESNIAFKYLLTQRENDKRALEENVLSNIKLLVLPYIEKLKKNGLKSKELSYLHILESNLKSIVSPFSHKLSSNYFSLSTQEIKIADLIKDGNQDKNISEVLNISLDTIKTHRQNIRKKLGISGKKTNLRTYLLSFIE